MKQRPSVGASLERVTGEVSRLLTHSENEPVGVPTAYTNAILRLADAVDRLAREIDSRSTRR
jgi:hypothetical protein